MANFLITGYWGEPHITAENDRGINAAIFGAGRFVLPVGQQFRAEFIGNNTIRMYDGKLMNNGAAAGIPAGEYIDLLIPNTSQGLARFDIIAFQYSQDPSTLVEKGEFVVIKGEEGYEPTLPTLTQEDLLTNRATFDQMALWRVLVTSTTISSVTALFEVWGGGSGSIDAGDITSGTLSIARGGTGGGTAAKARSNLGAMAAPTAVTGTGAITVTLANDKEYTYTGVTSLNMTAGAVDCHGFVTFANSTPTISIGGHTLSMGGIADAAAGETWEFDCKKGYILWVKWGE